MMMIWKSLITVDPGFLPLSSVSFHTANYLYLSQSAQVTAATASNGIAGTHIVPNIKEMIRGTVNMDVAEITKLQSSSPMACESPELTA